ncbi:hypothetical protein K9O30_00055 [Clostridium bowmanii]|uniref:hypothetical protein n=1 Tax=Clostridium bowmanii TaxID=132925 RepID=UPI001C0BE3D7|nr:hypothetical protein [Clostridium bowmanii]MBU3187987.1 hypothetical protein [Clostridium bowmanii]MCA1072164.1 hypothetical protein [Clostridium bowmanii]
MTKAIDKLICQISKEWLHIPGVIDIASSITNENDCILVFVTHKTSEVEKNFPCNLNGFPVIIIETTDFYIG